MNALTLTIETLGPWHMGSGEPGVRDLDAVVSLDHHQLPWIPGKTLKGLLREAAQLAEDFGHLSADWTLWAFGARDADVGALDFRAARLPAVFIDWWKAHPQRERLRTAFFQDFSSTALNEHGIAEDKTLRRVEAVIPLTLDARVSLRPGASERADWSSTLIGLLPLVRRLGSHRTRGWGRCRITSSKGGIGMSTLSFTVELLSDISITRDAATEGAHVGLDYLPGSLFLGWVAGQRYAGWKVQHTSQGNLAWLAFHSGKVRFGPATLQGGLPSSFSWHHRKGAEFTHNQRLVPDSLADLSCEQWETWEQKRRTGAGKKSRQPQQVRSGWFDPHTAAWLEPDERMRMKTAMDRDGFGRAKESQLFGYSALCEGQLFSGCIEIDDDVPDRIITDLTALFTRGNELRLGRSRSAEFGAARVACSAVAQDSVEPDTYAAGACLTLFAATDLCLLDADGQPTADLGAALTGTPLAGARIVREHTHVRTRRYASWNAFHQSPGPFRFLVEKGSVFVLELADRISLPSTLWLGQHQSEGLGRLLVNPAFLSSEWELDTSSPTDKGESSTNKTVVDQPGLAFVSLLLSRHRATRLDAVVREQGLDWARAWRHWKLRRSQWSRVREACAKHPGREALLKELRVIFTHGLTSKHWRGADNSKSHWPANKLLAALGAPPIEGNRDYRTHPDAAVISFQPLSAVETKLTDVGLNPHADLDAFLTQALHHAASSIARFQSHEP